MAVLPVVKNGIKYYCITDLFFKTIFNFYVSTFSQIKPAPGAFDFQFYYDAAIKHLTAMFLRRHTLFAVFIFCFDNGNPGPYLHEAQCGRCPRAALDGSAAGLTDRMILFVVILYLKSEMLLLQEHLGMCG